MSNMIKCVTQQFLISLSVGITLFITTSAQAVPTIIDSIPAEQLTGISVYNISSLYADHGNLWITDKRNTAYEWFNKVLKSRGLPA